MQVFKLVSGGFVDKVIAFQSLPKNLLAGIRTRDTFGLPSAWRRHLESNGSVRDVMKTETEVLADRNLKIEKTPIGKEACFWVLDYVETNSDKEKWAEIESFVRGAVEGKVRLKDKLSDMATPMAPNPTSPLELDPENIPVINIPLSADEEVTVEIPTVEYMTPIGGEAMPGPKHRGRPKKVTVEA